MGLLLKLKNGDTELKSLRYGKDRPGGGDSGQPFINTPIPNELKDPKPFDIDGFVRGGLEAPIAAQTDAERLSNYLFNFKNPSGLLFIAKQNILSRISPKTESSFGVAYGGGLGKTIDASTAGAGTGNIRRDNSSSGGFNEGIYTPLSTIGQARVGYLGTHLNKQGLDPSGAFPAASIRKYGETVFESNKSVNNNYQPGVPLNLYRQYLRTEKRYGRSSVSSVKAEQRQQQQKYNLKQVKTPEVSFGANKGTGLFISNPTRVEKVLQGTEDLTNNVLQSSTNALNKFLIRWDNFLDKRADRIADRKYNKNQRLGIQLEGLENEMEDAQMKPNKFDNRLLNLWNTQGLNKSGTQFITSNPNVLSYGGGPGSALGLGNTNIKFATLNDGITPARTGVNRRDINKNSGYKNYGLYNTKGDITYNPTNIFGKGASDTYLRSIYNGLYSGRTYTGDDIWGQDFLTNIQGEESVSAGKLQPWADDNNTPDIPIQRIIDLKNKQEAEPTRFNIREIGDAGASLTKGKIVSKLNSQKIYSSNKDFKSVPELRNDDKLGDLVEFTIVLQAGDNLNKRKYLTFPAFIDSYSEDFSADYKSINYMGRPEPFYKYSGFKRGINLSFTVVAQSRPEIGNMYTKLNFLASSVAPSYTNAGYMTGNLAYLTFGDICKNKPGIIEGFSFSVPEEASWDIGLYKEDGEVKGDGAQMPMMIKVNGFKFTPLYEDRPEWGTSYWFGNEKITKTASPYESINNSFTPPESTELNQGSDAFSDVEEVEEDINKFIGPSEDPGFRFNDPSNITIPFNY